ncbi:MAG: isoprenylcysteine carboxylmethyltransferase family protein [Acidobacteria bacterium]|nr:isoprenylcysteine carboxylmethyltransferase family protein [Acidobacteriota bacterium]
MVLLPSQINPTLIRTFSLFLPIAFSIALCFLRKANRKLIVGAMLASLWSLVSLVALESLVNYFNWWHFQAIGGLLYGIPLDLLIGWSLLWGAIPIFISKNLRLPIWLVVMLVFDLFFMPLYTPVLELNQNWILGEIVLLLASFIPAQLLGRWTIEGRQLFARTFLQVVCFSILSLFILPLVIFEQVGGDWKILFTRPNWLNSLNIQLLALPALLGVSAVQEFVLRGYGTPIPYDPPKRLVTSGFYRYVANPMQLSMALVLFGYGMMLKHFWLSFSGLVAFAYGAGIANWDEKQDLYSRFGQDWINYRKEVKNWLPRWKPWHLARAVDEPTISSAKLYFDEDCNQCSELANWFKIRSPIGLVLVPAQDHPRQDLKRLTYDPCDGTTEEEGICAFARALEHINFAYAFIGAFMRLPLVNQFIQLISDASGGEPRKVCRRKT